MTMNHVRTIALAGTFVLGTAALAFAAGGSGSGGGGGSGSGSHTTTSPSTTSAPTATSSSTTTRTRSSTTGSGFTTQLDHPPGWYHGRKRGWDCTRRNDRNCRHLPPGLR
jgi:hypothetical protein